MAMTTFSNYQSAGDLTLLVNALRALGYRVDAIENTTPTLYETDAGDAIVVTVATGLELRVVAGSVKTPAGWEP